MIERLTERVKATWGNLGEALGGVAAPLMVGLTAIVVVSLLAVAAVKLRPRRRIGYATVPDPNFAPSLEEIIRWSLGLAEARAAVGFGTNSHKMVRLTFCSDHQGNLVSLIGLNPRARSVAERNGYGRVELADADEVLGELAPTWLPPTPLDIDDEPSSPVATAEPVLATITDTIDDTLVPELVASGGGAGRWDNVL